MKKYYNVYTFNIILLKSLTHHFQYNTKKVNWLKSSDFAEIKHIFIYKELDIFINEKYENFMNV